jgi:malate synthase
VPGSLRVIVVLENARALFRAHEIADALRPYFCGASLGWHDLLASTARLFKEDATFTMPPKSDPSIVVTHVRKGHELLAAVVGKARGGLAIGGMFGAVPARPFYRLADPALQACLRGLLRDAIAQRARGLRGFWLASPQYVRTGLAAVAAWDALARRDDGRPLERLVRALVEGRAAQDELLAFAATERHFAQQQQQQ